MITKKLGTAVLLYSSAQKLGLQPKWLVRNGPFTINTPNGEKYVSYARSSLNSHVSAGISTNKHHTRVILGRHGLPNIPYTKPNNMAEAYEFLLKHKTIIVKPVSGGGAKDIRVVNDISVLEGVNVRKYIFEKYVTGKEMRYLILNNNVIAVHQSEYGVSVEADRYLERISFSKPMWDKELTSLSLKIARILRLKFIAVDFLINEEGEPFVLEVNTNPGLKWFHAPTSGPPVDVASMFLRAII